MHFLSKLQVRDQPLQREIAMMCRTALCERLLGHCGSALRVAVLAVVLLSAFKERKARKVCALWLRFVQELDQKAGSDSTYWSAFDQRVVSGDKLIDVIVHSRIEALLTLKGPWKQTLRQWRGPVKASFLPASAFHRGKQSCVWTFAQYQFSQNRYYWHALQLIVVAIIVPMSSQFNFSAIKSHLIAVNLGATSQLPLNWTDATMLFGAIMSLSEGAYALQLYLGVCLQAHRLQPVEGSVLVAGCVATIAGVYLAYSSWCSLSSGYSQMVSLSYAVSFWVLALVSQVIYSQF